MSIYLDSSAIVKLIINEDESTALRKVVKAGSVTSVLGKLEVLRTIDRGYPDMNENEYREKSMKEAHKRFDGIALVEVDATIFSIASGFHGLPYLRTLDSIHLASALLVKAEIETFITYDKQLARAAELMGFKVAAPA